eukprot:TRINITY_DN67901_c1_g2_i5.p1 TRINITY_DN67901_c1_g2~~TRINITY_DN67901_c1_g2_i5.p1  ORF type:complete len:780 (-),score=81.35 TRINITY_DN67901_c1_g2_i5:317-2656(-)
MSTVGLFRDDKFCQLFRLSDENTELDKLTLLACNRQGVMVDELMFKPEQHFAEPGLAPDKRTMRFNTYEKRRQAKINLVEDERSSLIMELFQKSTYKAKLNEDGTIAAAVDTTVVQTDPEYTRKLREKADADINRLRVREMKLVERQMQFEVSREELDNRIKAREDKRVLHEQAKQRQREKESKKKQKLLHEKLDRLRLVNAIHEEQKREKTLKKEDVRKEREVRKHEETVQYQQAKAEELANKLYTVTERHKLVQESMVSRAEMQLKDMAHKQQLHYERRKFLTLHRDTLKEVNKIKALQKQIAIHESCAQRNGEEELWKETLLEKYSKAQERVEEQKEHKRIAVQEKRLVAAEKERRRKERVCRNELKTHELAAKLLDKHEQKAEIIAMKKAKLDVDAQIRAEQKRIRMQNWMDNKARIDRVTDYKQMVILSKIEQDKNKIERMKNEKDKMLLEHTRQRQATALQKEKLLAEISHLRTSAEPHAFLAKSKALSESIAAHKGQSPTASPNAATKIVAKKKIKAQDSPTAEAAAADGQSESQPLPDEPTNTARDPEHNTTWDDREGDLTPSASSLLMESVKTAQNETDNDNSNSLGASQSQSQTGLEASSISQPAGSEMTLDASSSAFSPPPPAAQQRKPPHDRSQTSLGMSSSGTKRANRAPAVQRPLSATGVSGSGAGANVNSTRTRLALRHEVSNNLPADAISGLKDPAAPADVAQLPGQPLMDGDVLGCTSNEPTSMSLYLSAQPRYQKTGRNMIIANDLVAMRAARLGQSQMGR